MRTHRFYVGEKLKLKADFWVHDPGLLWQWNRVLRFKPGQKAGMFDGEGTDRLYEVVEISKAEAHLKLITELKPIIPKPHVYLFWSLLKKDNNDHVLQKCTELGVSNFVPLITSRAIRTNFNMARAEKIVVEASEQCGRSNIPTVREPMHLSKAIEQYKDHLSFIVCEHGESRGFIPKDKEKYGLLIGPEGGWSEEERKLFKGLKLLHLSLSNHTLRAETATVVAASKLL